MIAHTFLTLLLPLLVALFYYSTPYSRKRPIFILNVSAIILATLPDLFYIVPPRSMAPVGKHCYWNPWFFSIHTGGPHTTCSPHLHQSTQSFGPDALCYPDFSPVLLKIGRLVNLIKVLADAVHEPFGSEYIAVVWETTPYLEIEWSAQVVDNAYASLAFLWTIRDRGIREGVTNNIHPTRGTFTQRMRTICCIALSNFIIPSLFSIAQLVVVYRNINILVVNDIALVNNMLAVFGVVSATVWASNVSRRGSVSVPGASLAWWMTTTPWGSSTPVGFAFQDSKRGAWRNRAG